MLRKVCKGLSYENWFRLFIGREELLPHSLSNQLPGKISFNSLDLYIKYIFIRSPTPFAQ